MINRDERRPNWRFFDGAVSISVSMWFAIALNQCAACYGWPVLGFLSRLAADATGIIIVATALLFPTAALLYGGIAMFFAAKDTVERWARAKDEKAIAKGLKQGLEQGLARGRKEERERIAALLKEHDVRLPPEILSQMNGDGGSA